jgi:SRSO17 transposase
MSGASIEETLELWAALLREVKARMRPLFTQDRVAASASLFLDGLLGEDRRKTGWMRAAAAGDPGPWRQQAILGRGRWDADALRDIVREYVVETLAEPDAVLVVDETGFLKQGKASCGVARQYTGSAGKITNCQIGVFAAYVSGKGHAFIDRALYLPKAWADDPARRAAAHVPQEIAFATKPHLARAMVERAIAAGVPFAWVAADSVYGTGEVEMAWRRAGKGYVLGVAATSQFNSWGAKPPVAGTAAEIAGALDPSAWRRLSAGAGAKGERLFDWAYVELADLEAAEYNESLSGLWTRGLLIRRNIADGALAFFATWCPAGTPVTVLVTVEGRRWAIEDSFETAKNELGLDHNETRSPAFAGAGLARLAPARHARHAGLCHDGGHPPPGQHARSPKKQPDDDPQEPPLICWSVQEIRRVACRLAQRQIQPAEVIAWSLWRRAHQAAAQKSHLKHKTQL